MIVPIGDGRLIVDLPNDFETTVCDDWSVLAYPQSNPSIEVYFSVNTIHPDVPTETGLGPHAITILAEENGAKLVELDDRCYFRVDKDKGRAKTKRIVSHWYIGYANHAVIITTVVPHRLRKDPTVASLSSMLSNVVLSVRENEEAA